MTVSELPLKMREEEALKNLARAISGWQAQQYQCEREPKNRRWRAALERAREAVIAAAQEFLAAVPGPRKD